MGYQERSSPFLIWLNYSATILSAKSKINGMVPTESREEVPTVWDAYPEFSPYISENMVMDAAEGNAASTVANRIMSWGRPISFPITQTIRGSAISFMAEK